jgi:hypothetical protein
MDPNPSPLPAESPTENPPAHASSLKPRFSHPARLTPDLSGCRPEWTYSKDPVLATVLTTMTRADDTTQDMRTEHRTCTYNTVYIYELLGTDNSVIRINIMRKNNSEGKGEKEGTDIQKHLKPGMSRRFEKLAMKEDWYYFRCGYSFLLQWIEFIFVSMLGCSQLLWLRLD